MRTPRLLAVPLLLLALAACKKAPPPERFIAGDSGMALVIPSLERFAAQTSDVLDTAATFPGGQGIDDLRAVVESRFGFDLFDAASLAGAGFDPRRGAAVGFRMEEGAPPAAIFVLPAGDAKKLGEKLDVLAKDKLRLEARAGETDPQEIVTWAPAAGAPAMLAYAFAEKNALLAVGPDALAHVQAALKVPKDGHLGTNADYKLSVEATGPGQAMVWFVSPASPMFALPQAAGFREMFKKGLAIGMSGAKERLALAVGMGLADDSPLLATGKADAGPLLAKLDPNAGWVMRSDVDLGPSLELQKGILTTAARDAGTPDAFAKALEQVLDAIGGAAAMGAGVVAAPAGALREAPLAFFRVEYVVGVKDEAKMKAALAELGKQTVNRGGGSVDLGGDGPWTFPVGGGEVGVAVKDKQLLLAAGPTGALQALVARTGTTFKPPTATATKAFTGPMGGMFIDIPKLAGGLQVIPAAAYGDDPQGTVLHANVQKVASALERFTAVSVGGELKGKAYRGELIIEVAPPPAK